MSIYLLEFDEWSHPYFVVNLLRTPIQSDLVGDNDNDDENENERESDDDGGDDVATMGDDAVETIVGGKERMGVRNKLGRSVGKAVVLLVA